MKQNGVVFSVREVAEAAGRRTPPPCARAFRGRWVRLGGLLYFPDLKLENIDKRACPVQSVKADCAPGGFHFFTFVDPAVAAEKRRH